MTSASATRLALALRRKEFSSLELIDAHLRRIAQVNPRLNAIIQLAGDRAREGARAADRALARGDRVGPLHGVPVTIKDSFDTIGVVSTAGTTGRRSFVPTRDATVVARLRAAGAIVVGKTNTPELTLSYETDNLIYGRTSNPYDVTRTSGGSSGGAAAIIAAGGSPLDVGSDTGGSIRVPSHFCGITGLKPTSGRVPRTGHIISAEGPFQSFTHIGPMARFVEDLILTLPILAGVDWRDAAIVPMSLRDPAAVSLSGLRVAVYTDNGIRPATADVARAVNDAAGALRRAGCSVEQMTPPELAATYAVGNRLWRAAGPAVVRQLLTDAGTSDVSPALRSWLSMPAAGSLEELTRILGELDAARGRMLAFLERIDAIVCPACAIVAPEHGATLKEDLDTAFSHSEVYNYVGWPAVVVRGGTSAEGLPVGVQVVARPWREDVALAVALRVERDLGGWRPPPL